MIQVREFKEDGAHLRPGEQTRINHVDCPAGRDTRGRLYIKRKDDNTLLAYCHNCGEYGISSSNKTRAIRDLLIENEVAQRDGAGELLLPDDIERNIDYWPGQARLWPLKYGISPTEVYENNICYSPSWNRIILPVYENGKLAFWQGRAVDKGQDPKYVSAKSHPKVMFWAHAPKPGNCIFIVEDMLSAIKMSRFADAVAMLGTSPDLPCLTSRIANYKKVGVFLDPDLAGISKSHELHKRLGLVFMGQVRQFIESRQPKEMSNAELERVVSGLRSSSVSP
jgi:hypothetical protein